MLTCSRSTLFLALNSCSPWIAVACPRLECCQHTCIAPLGAWQPQLQWLLTIWTVRMVRALLLLDFICRVRGARFELVDGFPDQVVRLYEHGQRHRILSLYTVYG